MMLWTDSEEIAIELYEQQPQYDPRYINFVDLRQRILQLQEFEDNPTHCGERQLEQIQSCWIQQWQ